MSNQARERNSNVDNLTIDNPIKTHSPAKQRRSRLSLVATLLTVAMLIGVNTGVFASGVDLSSKDIAIESLRQRLISENDGLVAHNAINEYIDLIKDNEVFVEEFAIQPLEAIENVNIVINRIIESTSSPYWNVGGVYGVSGVSYINQEVSYYCSVASTLQVLTAYGKQGNVTGETNRAKMDTIASFFGLTSNSNFAPAVVASMINKYVEGATTYASQYIGNIQQLHLALISAFSADSPLILNADTWALSYYNGYNTGHYIVVKGYNPATQQVIVSDCNYRSPYLGEHTITLTEAFNSVKGKFVIYGD